MAVDNVNAAQEFANAIVNPEAALPAAIEWIADNTDPGDIYPEEKLSAWAKARGWTPPPPEAQ